MIHQTELAVGSNEFVRALASLLKAAETTVEKAIRVTSAELHINVGGYPGPNHRMPACCSAMRQAMRVGDKIIAEPPKGVGASLTSEYVLPRKHRS